MRKTLKNTVFSAIFVGFGALLSACVSESQNLNDNHSGFVKVSPLNHRYLAYTTGETYVPVGMNVCFPRFLTEEEAVLADYESKFKALSENGGNYVRIWLSHPFFEIEDAKEGVYNPQKIARLDRLFDLADKYGIKMKLCFENFIKLKIDSPIFSFNAAPPFDKRIYLKENGGSFEKLEEFFTTKRGLEVYLARAKTFADRYKNRKCVFAWEVWNESSCISLKENRVEILKKWHAAVMPELHKLFPNHMVVMSMPSYDNDSTREVYTRLNVEPANDITQVHNYLNEGRALPICQSPTDLMCLDAVDSMLKLTPDKPVLFAEVGAAEPNHVGGPSRYYKVDKDGILLTDQTFVPFFCGAAGNGMSWHWEYYVQKHNLWHVFGRFSRAIKGIDPVAEKFVPRRFETPNVRAYVLDGKSLVIAYIRDKNNSWQTELRDGVAAQPLNHEILPLAELAPNAKSFTAYLPFADSTFTLPVSSDSIVLPDFLRCCVIVMKK